MARTIAKYLRYTATPHPSDAPLQDGFVGWLVIPRTKRETPWNRLKALPETVLPHAKDTTVRRGQWIVVDWDGEEEFAYVCGMRQHGRDVLLCVSNAIDLNRYDLDMNIPPQLATNLDLKVDDLVTSTELRVISANHISSVVTQDAIDGITAGVEDFVPDVNGDPSDVDLCSALVWDKTGCDMLDGSLMVETVVTTLGIATTTGEGTTKSAATTTAKSTTKSKSKSKGKGKGRAIKTDADTGPLGDLLLDAANTTQRVTRSTARGETRPASATTKQRDNKATSKAKAPAGGVQKTTTTKQPKKRAVDKTMRELLADAVARGDRARARDAAK